MIYIQLPIFLSTSREGFKNCNRRRNEINRCRGSQMRLKSVKNIPLRLLSVSRKKKWTLNCTNEVMHGTNDIHTRYVEISVGKCYFIGKEWILIFSRNCEFAN